ncbi:MAG: DNA-processing protein DprA, partial [Clostridia bacterium]|nr:DNA-processing protein DprA [Clostridia bacterium]
NPPTPLFFKGHLHGCLSKPTITIVGTRKANGYSEEMAKDITTALCHCGFTVVCGVAEGIDTFVLESAIHADCGPIAVLPFGILSGGGISANHFKDIQINGALISEVFPRNKSHKYAYHERNRILSGLSHGTVVVQAPKRSGALMTANYASEQDRDLFAVMANASLENEGSNNLIKDGCFPVTDYTDILQVYLPQFSDQIKELICKPEHIYSLQEELAENKLVAYRKKNRKQLNDSEWAVFEQLTTDETDTDTLIEKSGLPVDEVLQCLTTLEFRGLIVSCPGSKFKVIL